MTGLLLHWLADLELGGDYDDLMQTAHNWVYFCHPHGATEEQLFCAELYLFIIFYLDDYRGEVLDMCEWYGVALRREPVGFDAPVMVYVIRRFLRHVSEQSKGANADDLRGLMLELVSGYVWRAGVKTNSGELGLCEYGRMRRVTINVLPYLELWRLLLGVKSVAVTELPDGLIRCRELAIRFMYLSNDLFSVEKDIEVGDPNYAVIYARESTVVMSVAIERTKKERQKALDSFWDGCAELTDRVSNDGHVWFLNFIQDLVRAFDSAMTADKSRYGEQSPP